MDVQQLLRDGITAAREGDKSRARTLLDEVVAQDPENEKGWFWLASVADSDEERMVYLGNVITINPDNERAQAILERLEARQAGETEKSGLDEEVMPGISRRVVIFGVAGIAIIVVVICGIFASVISNNNRAAAERQQTADAALALQRQTEAAVATVEAEATQAAILSSTTPTPLSQVTLPPTWTPAPSPTSSIQGTAEPLTSAIDSGLFSGRILAASGQDITQTGFVNIVSIPLDGSSIRTLFEGRAASPSMSPQGDRLVYTRASSAGQGIEMAWPGTSQQPRLLSQILGGRILAGQDDASFSPDGNSIAFSAKEPGSVNSDIFVLNLTALGSLESNQDVPPEIASQALRRLTDGVTNNTAPAWGDSTHLVYVADGRNVGGEVDLKLVDLAGTVTSITADGSVLIEDNPDLSPDGTRVVFEAYAPDNPTDVNIYIAPTAGGQALLLTESTRADVRPRFSPDGRYVVYSSERSGGGWEIYTVDVASYATYQVTVNNIYDVANAWIE